MRVKIMNAFKNASYAGIIILIFGIVISIYGASILLAEMDLDENHAFTGRNVQAMAKHLPHNCILVSIRRNNRVIIPHGDTILQKGDHLVTLASEACAIETHQALNQQI